MKAVLRAVSTLVIASILGAIVCLAQNTSISAPEATNAPDVTALGDPAPHLSQIRIVRLSLVEGQVKLNRNTGQTFEPAVTNMPIVAGEQLKAGDGLAEVEFEDNTSLRLVPNSQVEFPVLGRQASGGTVNSIKLVSGSLYMDVVNAKGMDGFSVTVGNRTMTVAPSSHLRIDLTPTSTTSTFSGKLSVFSGSVTLPGASGTTIVAKKKAVTFDLASNAAPLAAHNDSEESLDKWDKSQVAYHRQRAAVSSFAGSTPYAYGLNDLSYYGSFADFGGGCGPMWRPYLATAAFDPYASGIWSYYPGAGYSWVSPYPWGWTPYHSGSWQYCQGNWGWQPGSSWNGLANQPAAVLRSPKGRTLPLPPPVPRPGQPTLLGVNLHAVPISSVNAENKFVFRGDSAGMGVPRGVFRDMGKISQNVVRRGSVSTSVSDGQAQRGFIALSRPASGTSAPSVSRGVGSVGNFGGGRASIGSSSSASPSRGGSASTGAGGAHH